MYLFSLVYGLLAAIGALALQSLAGTLLTLSLSPEGSAPSIAITLIILASIEESCKMVAVSRGVQLRNALSRTTILHALFVGIGFSIVEYSLIALQPYDTNPFATLSNISTMIIHISSPLIIAALLIALRNTHFLLRVITTITTVTLLHASYNILAFNGYALTTLPQRLLLGAIIATTFLAVTYTIATQYRHTEVE